MNDPDDTAIPGFNQETHLHDSPAWSASYVKSEPPEIADRGVKNGPNLHLIITSSEGLYGQTPNTASLVSTSKYLHKHNPRWRQVCTKPHRFESQPFSSELLEMISFDCLSFYNRFYN